MRHEFDLLFHFGVTIALFIALCSFAGFWRAMLLVLLAQIGKEAFDILWQHERWDSLDIIGNLAGLLAASLLAKWQEENRRKFLNSF